MKDDVHEKPEGRRPASGGTSASTPHRHTSAPTRHRHTSAPTRRGSLDPVDWEAYRASCHRTVDEMIERFQAAGEGPVWRPVPDEVKARRRSPLPLQPSDLDEVLDEVRSDLLPYTLGNTDPRFFGWVHGAGTPAGALADFLAGAMNANTGGRQHAPILFEEQVIGWVREMFGFPSGSTGLLVSGTSMATIVGLAVARHRATGGRDRNAGVSREKDRLVGYATEDGHLSIRDAFSLLGLGGERLRAVAMGPDGAMDPDALRTAIERDRAAGLCPFVVIATSGSVTCGAMDDLVRIRAIADEFDLWMHVDGAFGAAARLSPTLAPKVAGIERADSLAFDFHKWFHVPYDAGCVLVRDGELHRAAFGGRADYLSSLDEGPAGGDLWPCELGPELSRGFRAFKVWFTLRHLGARAIGDAVERNCRQARHLARRIAHEEELELMAPAELNIVCFRYRPPPDPAAPWAPGLPAHELNELNREILLELHRRGLAVPSPLARGGDFAIRVCLCNHRTRTADLDLLAEAVLELGRSLVPAC